MSKTIKIPKGYTPSRVEIKDGLVCLVFEPIEPPKEFIPKDGDFCTSNNNGYKCLFIFKREENGHLYHACFDSTSKELDCNSFFAPIVEIAPATEAEKQTLLSEIDKAGFVWNAEKKRIEKKRWRAEIGEDYYYDEFEGSIQKLEECNDVTDDDLYHFGNYFKTEQQASEASCLIKELLFHFHEQDEILNKIKELLCVKD